MIGEAEQQAGSCLSISSLALVSDLSNINIIHS